MHRRSNALICRDLDNVSLETTGTLHQMSAAPGAGYEYTHSRRQRWRENHANSYDTVTGSKKGITMKVGCSALLLLGPTGSGKTPLGEALERSGIHGKRAVHFDFGACLREAVDRPDAYPLLSRDDIGLLENKLRENALLDDDEFYIAERIVVSFAATRHLEPEEYLILNGLPRHTGQAKAMNLLVRVEEVIYLDCSTDVIRHRILSNAGGDRALRADDSAPEIERKCILFRERTMPLIGYYRSRGIPVRRISVTVDMSIAEMLAACSCQTSKPSAISR